MIEALLLISGERKEGKKRDHAVKVQEYKVIEI